VAVAELNPLEPPRQVACHHARRLPRYPEQHLIQLGTFIHKKLNSLFDWTRRISFSVFCGRGVAKFGKTLHSRCPNLVQHCSICFNQVAVLLMLRTVLIGVIFTSLLALSIAAGPGLTLLSPAGLSPDHYHAPEFDCLGELPAVTGTLFPVVRISSDYLSCGQNRQRTFWVLLASFSGTGSIFSFRSLWLPSDQASAHFSLSEPFFSNFILCHFKKWPGVVFFRSGCGAGAGQ
jgi:hypothetical protein